MQVQNVGMTVTACIPVTQSVMGTYSMLLLPSLSLLLMLRIISRSSLSPFIWFQVIQYRPSNIYLYTMTFTILPAEKGDLTELVELFHEAFATDPDFSIIYGKCDRKEVIKFDVVGYEEEYDTPGRRFFKLIDDENGYVNISRG